MSWHAQKEAFKQEYHRKLKSPKWQKKRLEIMERAGFECECCFDDSETLQIHHLIYLKGKDPWDYPNGHLECLCESCHEWRENFNERYGRSLKLTWALQDVVEFLEDFNSGKLANGHFGRVRKAMMEKGPSEPPPEYHI